MAKLTGTAMKIDLGSGFEIRAPGITGEANAIQRRAQAPGSTRARSEGDGTPALEQALGETNMTEVKQIELKLDRKPPAGAVQPLRSADNRQDVIELLVPTPAEGKDQVVMSVDEYGVVTWHLPVAAPAAAPGAASRGGAGAKQTFLIPATRTPPPAVAAPGGAQRGVIGIVGRKLLKVLVYPITDPILGLIGEKFAEHWEEKNRPYGLRSFTPENFRDRNGPPLTAEDFKRLGEGRALLFIHGTFSTAHGAFCGIGDDVMRELHQRYKRRVFAFNHFTLSHDPKRNAKWFVDNLPQGAKLEVDIVCHSRGGLVARSLDTGNSSITVKRVVFAGVPNAGTLLAQPDHMVKMIDRLTTATNLFPTGPVTEFLEGLITAVKVLGHAGLRGLGGLAAMDPKGDFIRTLNQPAQANAVAYAIAADYEPTDAGMKALVIGTVADAIMDRVFEKAANDLVVPQLGVFEKNGGSAFPIPQAQVMKIDKDKGVMHTTIFNYEPAQKQLLQWLPG